MRLRVAVLQMKKKSCRMNDLMSLNVELILLFNGETKNFCIDGKTLIKTKRQEKTNTDSQNQRNFDLEKNAMNCETEKGPERGGA